MRFTMKNKALRAILIAALWLGLWWLVAICVGKDVLVPSPWQVAVRLSELVRQGSFWEILFSSILRITVGFLAGALLGAAVGVLTALIPGSVPFLAPLLTVIKTAPVASFIILALVWLKADAVPVFIAFLMVFPILQSNVCAGIRAVSPALLEMLQVFRVKPLRRIHALYLPSVLPYFTAGCSTAFGLAWKAGVAAEVISLPMRSIGRQLYFSKLYLQTTDVFAWTVMVVLLSLVMEKLLTSGLHQLTKGGDAA